MCGAAHFMYKRRCLSSLESVIRIFVVHIGQEVHLIAHFDHEIGSRIVVFSSQGFFDLRENGQALFRIAAQFRPQGVDLGPAFDFKGIAVAVGMELFSSDDLGEVSGMRRYWSSRAQRLRAPRRNDSMMRFWKASQARVSTLSGWRSRALKFSQTVRGALPNMASRSSLVKFSKTSTSER